MLIITISTIFLILFSYLLYLINLEYNKPEIVIMEFFHPIIEEKYYKIFQLFLQDPNNIKYRTILECLTRMNNYYLKDYSLTNETTRLDYITKNHQFQTIFNLIDITN
jgi:hypothetical protein